MPKGYFYV